MNPKTPKSFTAFFDASRKSDTYWEERAILDFTEEVQTRLDRLGLTKTDLAQRLKASPAFVTKLMGGNNNYTLRTMAKIARVLSAEVRIKLENAGAQRWRNYVANVTKRSVQRPPLAGRFEVNVKRFKRLTPAGGAAPAKIYILGSQPITTPPQPTDHDSLAAAA